METGHLWRINFVDREYSNETQSVVFQPEMATLDVEVLTEALKWMADRYPTAKIMTVTRVNLTLVEV